MIITKKQGDLDDARKSPPSEFILEIIKSKSSLSFVKEFEKGDNFKY